MSMSLMQGVALTVPAGSGTTVFALDPIDYSQPDELRAVLHESTIGTDAADTYNFYLQERYASGVWGTRIAWSTLTGDMADGEERIGTIQQFGTFDASEEMYEPSGSAGGSQPTAGTVINGGFANHYYGDVDPERAGTPDNYPASGWRLICVAVDADADGGMTGNMYLYGNIAD